MQPGAFLRVRYGYHATKVQKNPAAIKTTGLSYNHFNIILWHFKDTKSITLQVQDKMKKEPSQCLRPEELQKMIDEFRHDSFLQFLYKLLEHRELYTPPKWVIQNGKISQLPNPESEKIKSEIDLYQKSKYPLLFPL